MVEEFSSFKVPVPTELAKNVSTSIKNSRANLAIVFSALGVLPFLGIIFAPIGIIISIFNFKIFRGKIALLLGVVTLIFTVLISIFLVGLMMKVLEEVVYN
jgi:hypothetical protein